MKDVTIHMPSFTGLRRWFGQVTTGFGLAGGFGAAAAVMMGQAKPVTLIPVFVMSAYLVVHPEGVSKQSVEAFGDDLMNLVNQAMAKAAPVAKTMAVVFALGAAAIGLNACGSSGGASNVASNTASIDAKLAPALQSGCQAFETAETNPLVQVALAGGEAAAGALGSPAAAATAAGVVSSVEQYGAAFCQNGAPAGDTTTVAQQQVWLRGIVTQLLGAVGVKPAA